MKCKQCEFESNDLNEFTATDEEDICLSCAGFEPPTCGEHGDY